MYSTKKYKIKKNVEKIVQKIYWFLILSIADHILPHLFSNKTINVKTIAIFLGPYRNLTTLTASILSLHPHCQVLNHAGIRVLYNKKLNFLKYPTQKNIDNFLKFAIYASLFGKKGQYGGGIFHSHAFDNQTLRDLYYGEYKSHLKKNIQCVIWKESHKITNHLKKEKIKINDLFYYKSQIKFILPIRNPLSCAVSNISTNHSVFFNIKNPDIYKIIDMIFEEYLFFLILETKHQKNFFHFFENELINKANELALFLDIPQDTSWVDNVKKTYKLNNNYDHRKELINYCCQLAEEKFQKHPIFKEKLIKLICE